MVDQFDLISTTIERVSETVEDLADDPDFLMRIIDAAGGNYGPDEAALVKKLIRELSNEITEYQV